MNLRIEDNKLRFKISKEELEVLMDRRCLNEKVNFIDKTLIVVINPQGSGDAMEVKMVLDNNEVYLNLIISSENVNELSDLGRSREGLKQEVDGFCINLQVDMREDNRVDAKRGSC